MEEAERELEAAKRISEVRVAAKKLNRARAELQWSDDETKQPPYCCQPRPRSFFRITRSCSSSSQPGISR
jgi:hypothetical protein